MISSLKVFDSNTKTKTATIESLLQHSENYRNTSIHFSKKKLYLMYSDQH